MRGERWADDGGAYLRRGWMLLMGGEGVKHRKGGRRTREWDEGCSGSCCMYRTSRS